MDVDSDNESDGGYAESLMSIPTRSISGSSVTSYDQDGSMRSASPVSVISIASDAELYRREYGRELNNYSDVYQLPADGEEFDRLGMSLIRLL